MKIYSVIVVAMLLAACGNTKSSTLPPGPLQKIDVINAVSLGAVCNDGSPAVYYFQPGQGTLIQDWVIHFQGGARCSTITDCKLESSIGWENSLVGDGILSDNYTVNPYFYEANHVYLRQCSSDGWTGTKKASVGSNTYFGLNTYYFKGSVIFKRVIQDLMANAKLKQAKHVLLTGASSGTQGVLQHLDWLANQLPQAQVKGVIDAGFFINIPKYLPSLDSVVVSMQNYTKLHGSVFDADCLLTHANNAYACMLPQTVIPYISTPLLIKQPQRDPVILELYGVISPYDNGELAYIDHYVLNLKASLMNQPLVYATANARHTTIARLRFPLEKSGQVYFSDFLGKWFYQNTQPASVIE